MNISPPLRSRGIAVLGMHRSGTSTLAGTLRGANVYFGDVLDKKFALNPKGLQEPPAILYMQEDLLVKNGGSWHEPPESIKWMPLHIAVRDLFIESRTSQKIWAFKDPRTLLTLDNWLEAFPELICVGIFRHPAEVAISIQQRNNFELDKCYAIWTHYNEKLLRYHKKLSFPIIEFVNDPDVMQRSFSGLLNSLNLGRTSESIAFFDSEMKHHERPGIHIPDHAKILYAQLQNGAM